MADYFIGEGSTTVDAPSDGDNVFVLGGSAAIVTNVDKSSITFVRFEVSRAYTGTFATAANPMYVEVTGQLIYAAQSGAMYYRGKDTTDATPLIQVVGGGTFHFVVDGTATRFEIGSGSAIIYGPAIATNIRVGGGSLTLLDDTSTDPTLLHLMSGGTVYTERGGTTFTNDAGTLLIEAGTNAITTLNCNGPLQIAKTHLTESGTITTANVVGHVPDTSKLTRPLTITNTAINMSLPGAQAFLDNPLITFTNAPTRYISDGRSW